MFNCTLNLSVMDEEIFCARLRQFCERLTGERAAIIGLIRLSGGASMESWSFDYAGHGYVLRRAASAELMAGRAFGHDVEAALVQAARTAGVKAPEVIGVLCGDDGLGTGYLMRRVEAEVNPARILSNAAPGLIENIATELATIHQIRPRDDIAIPILNIASALADLKARFQDYGGDRPVIALAIRWCEDHLPPPVLPVLVHGDFRLGNIMVDENGLAAVLDWELAHWGDPHEDLAWGCVGAWRFANYHQPAFGLAGFETYFAAYEAATGAPVDRTRFRFWLIYRTLWWAIGCLQMAETWRSGADRSLERAVIGRRTSENEVDLLLLLEEQMDAGTGALSLPMEEQRQRGEPSASELLQAVSEWIATDVKAHVMGREKFMAAVAINALGIVQRELAHPVEPFDHALCEEIFAGRVTFATPGLLEKLRGQMLAKLGTDVPKYPALVVAREKWSQ
ncbi:MAG: phosphotransferase family protein [Parasphingorhabdus sp.]|nr:phosphotransferase family protein [Parasphingorhabdus sp.]